MMMMIMQLQAVLAAVFGRIWFWSEFSNQYLIQIKGGDHLKHVDSTVITKSVKGQALQEEYSVWSRKNNAHCNKCELKRVL